MSACKYQGCLGLTQTWLDLVPLLSGWVMLDDTCNILYDFSIYLYLKRKKYFIYMLFTEPTLILKSHIVSLLFNRSITSLKKKKYYAVIQCNFHHMTMTVIVMHRNIFLKKFLSLLPRCQVWLDDVVYPWFFFFVYSLDKKGKDLNLFFSTEFTSSPHFSCFLTKRILMKGRVRYLQGYKRTWR